jgi:hypothetical protein
MPNSVVNFGILRSISCFDEVDYSFFQGVMKDQNEIAHSLTKFHSLLPGASWKSFDYSSVMLRFLYSSRTGSIQAPLLSQKFYLCSQLPSLVMAQVSRSFIYSRMSCLSHVFTKRIYGNKSAFLTYARDEVDSRVLSKYEMYVCNNDHEHL